MAISSSVTGILYIAEIGNAAKLQGVIHEDKSFLLIGELLVEPNQRNKGLGSRLLEEAGCFAKRKGLSWLRGNICTGDLKNSPFLLQFYEKRGFKIVEPLDERFGEHGIEKYLDE